MGFISIVGLFRFSKFCKKLHTESRAGIHMSEVFNNKPHSYIQSSETLYDSDISELPRLV